MRTNGRLSPIVPGWHGQAVLPGVRSLGLGTPIIPTRGFHGSAHRSKV